MNILGLEVTDIPEDWTVLGVAMVVDCIDAEGEHVMCTRWTGMDDLRALGAFSVLGTQHKQDIISRYIPEG